MRIFLSLLLFKYHMAKKCTLPNAKTIKTSTKTFCAVDRGKTDDQFEAAELCKQINAKLPLPRNDEENSAFWSPFKSGNKNQSFWLDITDPIPCLGKWEDSDGNKADYFSWSNYSSHEDYQYPWATAYAETGKWIRSSGSKNVDVLCIQQLTGPSLKHSPTKPVSLSTNDHCLSCKSGYFPIITPSNGKRLCFKSYDYQFLAQAPKTCQFLDDKLPIPQNNEENEAKDLNEIV